MVGHPPLSQKVTETRFVYPAGAVGRSHELPPPEMPMCEKPRLTVLTESRAQAAPLGYGIYVHVPYCRRRCPYCDFYFEVRQPHAAFAEAIQKELSARITEHVGAIAHTGGIVPQSIYFGGGTPSALSDDALVQLVDALRAELGGDPQLEISVEINPEDIEPGRCERWAAHGVNRLSMGLQSFDDDVLRYLGRAHTGAQGVSAIRMARAAGIERISVDWIAGVPGEPADRWSRELARLEDLGVGHLSAYLLTLEPGTPLEGLIRLGKRASIDDDQQADVYEQLQALLTQAGYRQYEVSSYAKPNQESRHNRLYWSKGSYLGLGPGAHSMRFLPAGAVERRQNGTNLEAWIAAPESAPYEREVLSAPEAFLEAAAFGLRDLLTGIHVPTLRERHWVANVSPLHDVLTELSRNGWLQWNGESAYMTPRGARFADAVAREILSVELT